MSTEMPETMAEKMKMTNISGVDHHALALSEPNRKPT
jgi:hypothetical protein